MDSQTKIAVIRLTRLRRMKLTQLCLYHLMKLSVKLLEIESAKILVQKKKKHNEIDIVE